ncbi:hypothetical protein [Chitinophaga sp. 212800010-3]|uniref:hypothetical protein n=1 Tax=unclassified Chitinophaga TaxID=2619133 RepID=UPI002DEC9765|nr:DUF4138 domain-containing protein [Chitinophaga sp. 212800010-3]
MKQVLCSILLCLLITYANAQTGTDSILTTKGAVTLITSGAPISTFQIGDGKNTDYDYRIVEGNMVFLRPITPNPRPTNLIVREGENIHYLIICYTDRADLARLKYTLSGKNKTTGALTTADGPKQAPRPGNGERNGAVPVANVPEENNNYLISVDTVTVGKIAEDFGKDHKINHQYEIKVDGVSIGYTQAMTLNNMSYFCFRVRNKGKEPYEIVKATLLHKEKKDTSLLHTMPILYRRGPATIAGKEEANEVFVVPSKMFKKEDEVVVVLQTTEGQQQLVLYVPVTALPRYMIAKQ